MACYEDGRAMHYASLCLYEGIHLILFSGSFAADTIIALCSLSTIWICGFAEPTIDNPSFLLSIPMQK